MALWILVGVLVLAALVVFAPIPSALIRGNVPLNPLGWFGYSEMAQVTVERDSAPTLYWTIVLLTTLLAAIFVAFIYAVARSMG